MRVLIYGGRDWRDQATMDRELDRLHAIHCFTWVINGGQVSRDPDGNLYGADYQAAQWVQRRGIPIRYFRANWKAEGKAAGPRRNQRMLAEGLPQIGIEFPGRDGTKDMRRRLDKAGVLVIEAGRTTAKVLEQTSG